MNKLILILGIILLFIPVLIYTVIILIPTYGLHLIGLDKIVDKILKPILLYEDLIDKCNG